MSVVAGQLQAEAAGRHVVARADDPKLTRLLFDSSLEGFLVDQEELQSVVCERAPPTTRLALWGNQGTFLAHQECKVNCKPME